MLLCRKSERKNTFQRENGLRDWEIYKIKGTLYPSWKLGDPPWMNFVHKEKEIASHPKETDVTSRPDNLHPVLFHTCQKLIINKLPSSLR